MFNLDTLLKDHQLYHSTLQQDCFITRRSGGTLYGQYKQSLRELYKRFRGLKDIFHEKELLKIDIEELQYKIENSLAFDKFEQEFEKKRNILNLKKKKLDMIELNKNIQDTEREFKRFYQQAYSLKSIIGELTEEKRETLDKEMWIYKLKEIAAIDIISTGRLKNTTIELISSLTKEDNLKITSMIADKTIIKWFEEKEPETFELLEIEETEILKYLNT